MDEMLKGLYEIKLMLDSLMEKIDTWLVRSSSHSSPLAMILEDDGEVFIQHKLGGPTASDHEKLKGELYDLQAKYDKLLATNQELCKERDNANTTRNGGDEEYELLELEYLIVGGGSHVSRRQSEDQELPKDGRKEGKEASVQVAKKGWCIKAPVAASHSVQIV
ncbi:hypothetical protein Scep_010066 [Stephania cephalantha]|uniref:Uncharacterized protein n=1 Tax=Stephania cephalantha TaxID=152367 RepID=A0AAP0JWK8_9MAGN